MKTISQGARGAAVEDIQQRLQLLGFLEESDIDGEFGPRTAAAIKEFCARRANLPLAVAGADDEPEDDAACDISAACERGEVDSKVWAALVDATYNLGDRTLYLRMPYFHGHDVVELQTALGALGFFCGTTDGIFGAHTEDALRKFQMNLGLPSDGIAGAFTFSALRHLEHSWAGKGAHQSTGPLGFARAADVLEQNALCLFGTDDFTRSIASRMSNLAYATNPASKIVSAEMLSVEPDDKMLLVQISTSIMNDATPTVIYSDEENLAERLSGALEMARSNIPLRVRVVFPQKSWMEAGMDRTAQHYAIALLDALCMVLSR